MRAAQFVNLGIFTGLVLLVAGLPLQVAMADDLVLPEIAISGPDGGDSVHLAMLDAGTRNQSASTLADIVQAPRSGVNRLPDPETATSISNASIRYFGTGSTAGVAVGSSEPMSLGDLCLGMLMGAGLITYQLCRKHRMLRPHRFGV